MGGCLHTPFEKNCYIPVNHRDPNTKVRLEWQVTEQDIREEFQRLLDNNVYTVWHNGKFDYQVLKCTCGICMKIDWDNMIACRMIDENEKSAKLKDQYIDKIDRTQEKYDIDKLFKGVEYADVDPEVFALYSATAASFAALLASALTLVNSCSAAFKSIIAFPALSYVLIN
jgi:DNA polymerase I-like protein with 3'-5' exonuclease and polymerase domains